MGLFAQRPEQDEEAVSLPGEPVRPRSAAELLDEAARVDAAAIDTGPGVASIVVPLPPVPAGTGEPGGE